jgi:hypothetical protein
MALIVRPLGPAPHVRIPCAQERAPRRAQLACPACVRAPPRAAQQRLLPPSPLFFLFFFFFIPSFFSFSFLIFFSSFNFLSLGEKLANSYKRNSNKIDTKDINYMDFNFFCFLLLSFTFSLSSPLEKGYIHQEVLNNVP